MESLNEVSLVAPCGMNCRICMAYLRGANKCPGSRGTDANKLITRARCKIKRCKGFQKGRTEYCFRGKDFPCDILRHLDKRYRTKYEMSMIDNLRNIKDFSIREFLKNEGLRWTCSQCAGTICVQK